MEVDNVILFLDEVHNVVGRNSSGSMDAANVLKPIGRGDLQLIGATTLDEFREHIEKDGINRRFQQ